jgi:hypothetical protein
MTKKLDPPATGGFSELDARFGTTDVTPDSHTSDTRPEGLPVPRRAREVPAPKKSTTRPAPAGMSRRSIYTTTAALDALLAAAERVVVASDGLVTKADAIAGLIEAGVQQEAAVTGQVREQLQKRLNR